jgi:hypothetical protein
LGAHRGGVGHRMADVVDKRPLRRHRPRFLETRMWSEPDVGEDCRAPEVFSGLPITRPERGPEAPLL